MKFMRRPDLDTQTRIHIVMLAWLHQGVYGKMTQIAEYYQISRTFLYQLCHLVDLHFESLFNDGNPLLVKDHPHLERMILLLRLEGKCSLSSLSSILEDLGYSPNSVGYLSQLLYGYGNQLPSTLTMPTLKLVFYLSDEIFSLNRPILVTIDAQSTAILKIELASDRSAESWKAHYCDLENHLFVALGMASDRGVGLIKGFEDALQKAVWVCDYFHEFRDFFKLVDQLEKKAYAQITDQEDKLKKFNNAKSEAHLEKRLKNYEAACQACEKAIRLYDELFYLAQTLREILLLVAPNGKLKSKTAVKAELEAVFSLIGEFDVMGLKTIIKSLKKHLDEIITPFGQLDEVYAELLEQVDKEALEFLTLAWHHQHFSHQTKGNEKRYHQRESEFWLSWAEVRLDQEFQTIQTLTFEKMDSIIRASSLVEMVNSIIRPYLSNSKGQITQEFLNLIMFYHNHRKYKSGKRKGKAPIELLTGEKLEEHWVDRLIQQKKDKEQRIIPFPDKRGKQRDTALIKEEEGLLKAA